MIFGSAVIIFINLGGLFTYYWGTQFYIALIDTIIVSLTLLVVQAIDFRKGKKTPEEKEEARRMKVLAANED